MFRRIRPLFLGALMVLPVGALAESETVRLGSAANYPGVTTAGPITSYTETLLQRRRRSATLNPIAIRVGLAAGDDSGLLIGFDLGLPSVSIGQGWTGRLDFDFWGFGEDDTHAGIILDQITSAGEQAYIGFGIGVVTGDEGGLGIKFLIGTPLTETLDLEFDLILHDDVTAAVIFRIHV